MRWSASHDATAYGFQREGENERKKKNEEIKRKKKKKKKNNIINK